MARDKKDKKKKGNCKGVFKKGIKVGFFLGKNKFNEAELQGAPRVFSEGVAVQKGMGVTAARRSSKAQLIIWILAHNNVNIRR